MKLPLSRLHEGSLKRALACEPPTAQSEQGESPRSSGGS